MERSSKIVVLGLDGATWDLIDPWMEQGHLPTLQELVARGTRGVLQSTMPAVSPLAWSTFLTGTNPGKHGIYGFIKRIEGEYRWRAVAASDRVGRPLWSYTDAQGLKSAFFYVPFTFPPSPLNGVMISGLGTPGVESDFVYPAELKSELAARFDKRYLVEPLVKGGPEEILDDILHSIDVQADIFQYVMSREPTSLAVFVFGQTDRVQHFYWKEMDASHPDHDPATPGHLKGAIQAVYERLDAAIGRIYGSLDDDTTLIVMSDHGFGPYHREFYLNNWLAQQGFLAYKDSVDGGGGSGFSQWLHKVTYAAIGLAEGRIPQKIVWPLRKYGLLSRLDQFNAYPAAAEIDWTRTRVYSADFRSNVYLNLRGREPSGMVDPGREAEELLQEVTMRLKPLRDPETGDPIIQQVYRQAELYSGPLAPLAPDLVVDCRTTYHCKPQPLDQHDLIVAPAGKFRHASLVHSAEHRPEGVVLLTGPRIRQAHRLDRADIQDLAPTVLYLLGCPLSPTFDGVPLVEAVRPGLRQDPVWLEDAPDLSLESADPVYSADEEQDIEERLQALGYL